MYQLVLYFRLKLNAFDTTSPGPCLSCLTQFFQMQEKEKAERLQSEPDEEGWVTIGKGGRKPGASKVEAAELLERKKKKKQKVTLNFKTI